MEPRSISRGCLSKDMSSNVCEQSQAPRWVGESKLSTTHPEPRHDAKCMSSSSMEIRSTPSISQAPNSVSTVAAPVIEHRAASPAKAITPNAQPYHYEQLKGKHSIRLLRFLPSSDSIELRCMLEEHDTEAMCTDYIALSYVWGNAEIRHPIILNDGTTFITSNLHEAMMHLRDALPHSSFWIDAICIDQNNPQERAHQVAQMKTIYSNAAEVVVWLGRGNEEIRTFSLFIEHHHNNCNFLNDPVEGCGLWLDHDIIFAMQHLQMQPYWSRVWIIQEVVVAKKVRILCGTVFLHWHVFTHFLRLLSYVHFRKAVGHGGDHSQSYPILRLENLGRASMNLGQALEWTFSSLATDSRDKIYAPLGLVNTGHGLRIVADYTMPPCTVYCIAIRAILMDYPWRSGNIETVREGVRLLQRECLDDAHRHEQASMQDGFSKLGCTGMKCGSLAVLQRIIKWQKLGSSYCSAKLQLDLDLKLMELESESATGVLSTSFMDFLTDSMTKKLVDRVDIVEVVYGIRHTFFGEIVSRRQAAMKVIEAHLTKKALVRPQRIGYGILPHLAEVVDGDDVTVRGLLKRITRSRLMI